MSRKRFQSLQTTCGQMLEAGTIILHIPGGDYTKRGPHQQDHDHYHWIGSIIKIEQCDSGILLHCKTTQGLQKAAHVNYMHSTTYPSGVMLTQLQYATKILSRIPQQMELSVAVVCSGDGIGNTYCGNHKLKATRHGAFYMDWVCTSCGGTGRSTWE